MRTGMRSQTLLFAVATLTPLPLLAMAALHGGLWVWVALGYLTVFTFFIDELVAFAEDDAAEGSEFPATGWLSLVLALAHFVVLALGVATISGALGTGITTQIGAFLAFGLFLGHVSLSNAHELIHRSDRVTFTLGKWIYISVLFGQHTTAHRMIHHRFVATDRDPNSARLGESFYRFARRAWWQSLVQGWQIETNQLKKSRRAGWHHPYIGYLGGGLGFAVLFAWAFGLPGLAAYLALSAHASAQILLADYVQHYGLRRDLGTDGRYEPVALRHSWNAPQPFSSALMLNAPRHSDHHANPSKRFAELTLPREEEAPMLPASLLIMANAALIPPLWHKIMDHRVAAWHPQEVELAQDPGGDAQ